MHGVPVVSLVEMATRPVHVHVEISASPPNPEAVISCHAQVISVVKNVSVFNKIQKPFCVILCHSELFFFLSPDDWNSVAHVFPFEMENGTEPFGTGECFKAVSIHFS